ncbi:MAG: 30S ribosome-binding factor RbfA [Sphingobacteriia bacterium]|nr:30S ribosome-binding factor RbfA [Sphingobacteriia bacterium]
MTYQLENYSSRQLKASENIRKALAEIFNSGMFIDEALFEKSITISNVTISADLQNATIFVSQLIKKDNDEEKLVESLNLSVPRIRQLLAKKIYLKRLPNLTFKADRGMEKSEIIAKVIKEIQN